MTRFEQIWTSLEDDEYRDAFNRDVDTGLAFQIRALREKKGWTQAKLGSAAGGKAQETISQWEDPNYRSYSLNSLKDLATAFDVGLAVWFVPFGEVVERNANLTPERIAPLSFKEEAVVWQQASLALTAAHVGEPVTIAATTVYAPNLMTSVVAGVVDASAISVTYDVRAGGTPADATVVSASGPAELKGELYGHIAA